MFVALFLPYIEDVEWLCKRVDVLEEERNNALHSPLWAYQRGPNEAVVMPLVALGHVRAKKPSEKNILAEFRWCRDRSFDLAKFALAINQSLSDYALPWPNRPEWPICQRANVNG
jgi:hypothetical protein